MPFITYTQADMARSPLLKAREPDVQSMAERSPSFFSEEIPAAFRLDNEVSSLIASKATAHISENYDPSYSAFDDLGEFTDSPYAIRLVAAQNPAHMQAMKEDIQREEADRALLEMGGGSATLARIMASVISPTTLLPAGSIVKTAKGINIAKSAKSAATLGGASMAVSETALQATQMTRTTEETALNIGGGIILGGLLGAGVSTLSKQEFTGLASKVEKDMKPSATPLNDGDIFTNSVTPQDLSAARAEGLTLDDLTLRGKATQWTSRASRIVNPFNRLINSPFLATRKTFVRMAEIPLKLNANADGKALPTAVETIQKDYNSGLARSYESINQEFLSLKKKEKSSGNPATTIKGFKEKISYALRNNDIDPNGIDEVTRAAQRIRQEIFEPIKKEAIEVGLFKEGISSKFADTYLTRMWSREKLLMNRPAAIKMFQDWADDKISKFVADINTKISKLSDAEEIAKLRVELNAIKNMKDEGYSEYSESMAQEMFEKFTTFSDNTVPDFIVPVTRGPLKEKLLDITDNVATPFLENDIAVIANSYIRRVGSQVAFTREFGAATLEKEFKEISNEFQDAVAAAGADQKKIRKLNKQYQRDIKDLEAIRDLLRGTFKRSGDPDGMLAQAGTVIADVQYMSKLGGVTVSSFPDAFRTVMVHGMGNAFGSLIDKINIPKELKAMQLEDLKDLGFDIETALATRTSSIADIADPYARGTALTRFTGEMAQGFSRMTLINSWNNIMKDFAALVTQRRILKNIDGMVNGKISAKEKEYLAFVGIDNNVAQTISEQFRKHGVKEKTHYISGIAKWDSTPAAEHAARVYKAALRKEADTIVVTKGVSEIPVSANTAMGKLIFQFKSFVLSAHQRVLMRGMQDLDANTGMGMIMMLAGGMMTAVIKKAENDITAELSGRKEKEDVEKWTRAKWIAEGLDRSGLFAVAWEANNIWEKAGGYGMTQMIGAQPASRFASRNVAGAIFGPTLGTVADAGSVIGTISSPLTDRDVYKSDVRAMRNMLPFQNLVGIKHFFDAVEGEAGENLKGQ